MSGHYRPDANASLIQHGEMNAGTKLAALNKFRSPGPSLVTRPTAKVLVVYDVQVKSSELSHIPLVVNYGAGFLKFST